jgi:hypothetical protein|eukprot:COSAG06_NODE_4712_length_4018_cov_2.250319_2_plen_132_part_00
MDDNLLVMGCQGDFLNEPTSGDDAALGKQFDDALPEWTARGRRMGFFLTLGGDESGVQFHRHNDGWNTLIAGRKRWFLYPPRVLPVPAFPAEDLPIRTFSLAFVLRRHRRQPRPGKAAHSAEWQARETCVG